MDKAVVLISQTPVIYKTNLKHLQPVTVRPTYSQQVTFQQLHF
jgi:hypothetical protein